ncbi:DUF4260 family protein [Streptomyces sp. NPDC006658]|uniref:DUF4260 family protein n=1 Tax=Streptomyces sp. NPDC006658 TaxID=3156900 RepID=UPI0033D3914E
MTATTGTTTVTRHLPRPALRRGAWLVSALFWSVLAVVEGVHHGWPAVALALTFLVLPDLTFLVALDEAPRMAKGQLPPRAVPYYNAMHRALVPLTLAVACAALPPHWPAAFAAPCGWLAHISYDRVLGYGLRTKEGFQRG